MNLSVIILSEIERSWFFDWSDSWSEDNNAFGG